MATEDEIADVYEDYLGKQNDEGLMIRLTVTMLKADKDSVFEDYEREHLIRMILNLDNTGKCDMGFEDLRKSVSTNDSCG